MIDFKALPAMVRQACLVPGFWLLLAGTTDTLAQAMRDPTVPPVAAGLTAGAASAGVNTSEAASVSVLVRDGVPYLMVGTRLYAKGQKFGQTQVENITETEVWLLEEGRVRRLPVFNGIERRAAIVKPSGLAP